MAPDFPPRLLEPVGTPPEDPARDPAVQEILEDYLDRVTAPQVGTIPYAERARFRQEAIEHLESLVEDLVLERDIPPVAAAHQAVREHGDAGELAAQALERWFQRQARGPLEKKYGHAACAAFGILVATQGLYLVLLQLRVFVPSASSYRLPLAPSEVRLFWPEPLPLPEPTPTYLLLLLYPLIAPFVAGWLIGRQVPSGAARATYSALTPLILSSFAIGTLLLPMLEGVLFALLQLVYWLPVCCATAHVSSILARNARCAGRTPWRRP